MAQSKVYDVATCYGVNVTYIHSGIGPLDRQAEREGEAIRRLLTMVPRMQVVHDSILWNKNTYRKHVQRAMIQTAFAKRMFSRFLSRTTPRGRKYRLALKTMRQTRRDR